MIKINMGFFFQVKCFYIQLFKDIKYIEYYIIKFVFSSKEELNTLFFMEKKFHKIFNIQFYNYLFEAAIYKKNLILVEYLIDKIDLALLHEKSTLNAVQTQLLTNKLKSENYFSWLAIIASHTNLQLMGLEKVYDYSEHFNFISYLLKHNKVNQFFRDKITQEIILKNCHEHAKKMFDLLFLELQLLNKKTLPSVMSSKKIHKI